MNWETLDNGNHDSSDMQGPGYLVSGDGRLYFDNVFDYDSWKYFEGELKGNERILKAIRSLMKNEISFDLFLNTYRYLVADKTCKEAFGYGYTDEGLRLVWTKRRRDRKLMEDKRIDKNKV